MISLLAFFAVLGFFAWKRIRTYLHIFQQEEYDGKRFINWLFHSKSLDKKFTRTAFIIGLPAYILTDFSVSTLVVILCILWAAWKENDPTQAAKKKLALTARAKRILLWTMVLEAAFIAFLSFHFIPMAVAIIGIHAVPFTLVLANIGLKPYEGYVQRWYRKDAEKKLTELRPEIIGMTGSFGKTSVKHILGHLLNAHVPTYYTPGSVNTVMGITRMIREKLEPKHKYFLVEMGAYGKGSIARLCKFTPPAHGIFTAVGHAHYERFKSLENVAEAKSELVDAVKQNNLAGGIMVVAYDVAQHRPLKARAMKGQKFVTFGEEEGADYRIFAASQTQNGLKFKLAYGKETFALEAPLYGLHHIRNIAAAFAMAHSLGVDGSVLVAALKTVPQISHRLEVIKKPDQATVIDDAFNSNPVGFSAALDLLKTLRPGKGGRRILVTPGMVELGKAHDEKHAEIGAKAAACADVLLAIRPERIEALLDSFNEENGKHMFKFESFDAARKWLKENGKKKDIVLLENDLPDLFEAKVEI